MTKTTAGIQRAVIAGLLAMAWMLPGSGTTSALEFSRHPHDSETLNAIEARGRIEPGDAAALEAYIARLPPRRAIAVYLNSGGGSMEEGMHLGRYFHRARIRTVVAGPGVICNGACSTAFLGGRDAESGKPWRAKGSTASLGFNSSRFEWSERTYTARDMSQAIARTQFVTLAMADYLKDVGASLDFLRVRLKAPASGMYHISNEEALSLGLYVLDDRTGELIRPEFLDRHPYRW
jgi:hypothetical protein